MKNRKDERPQLASQLLGTTLNVIEIWRKENLSPEDQKDKPYDC